MKFGFDEDSAAEISVFLGVEIGSGSELDGLTFAPFVASAVSADAPASTFSAFFAGVADDAAETGCGDGSYRIASGMRTKNHPTTSVNSHAARCKLGEAGRASISRICTSTAATLKARVA